MDLPVFTSPDGTQWSVKLDQHGNYDAVVSQTPMSVIEGMLDVNKAMANHNDGYNPARDMRRVASIPFAVMYHWQVTEGWDPWDPANADKIAAKLNDPDWAYLRTAPGRLGVSNGKMR